MKKTLAVIVLSAALVACNKPAQQTAGAQPATPQQAAAASVPQTGSQPALPPGHPAIPMATTAAAPAAAAAAPSGSISGVVIETMNSGGYTYLELKTADGKEVWAAVQQTTLKKGQKVTVAEQMTAEKFQSNTLKRTFDRIVFGTIESAPAPNAVPASMPAMPPGHPNMSSASAMGTPAQHMSGGGDVGNVKVERAEGGRTVAEVWANKSKLADQQVVVRGKVVKFLGGIMGKNWLHLRDGSGSADKGDHDITVTTTDMATVGDVVTITGAVRVDRDFGAGYRYPVIIEDASVKK